MSGFDAEAIVTKCLGAWTSGDIATARSLIRDDVSVVGPFGANEGVLDYVAQLEGLSKIVRGAEQKKVIVDGDDVCVLYDLMTVPAGPLPTSSWYHITDGKIDAVWTYFDARLLTPVGSPPSSSSATTTDQPAAKERSGPPTSPVFVSAEMEIAEWDGSP
ncbi:MAG: nuclear transport factor 2 family protein [Acidimicrobiales bacterium]